MTGRGGDPAGPRRALLARDPALRAYVAARLADDWSPEQIAGALARESPDRDRSARVARNDLHVAVSPVPRRAGQATAAAPALRAPDPVQHPQHRDRLVHRTHSETWSGPYLLCTYFVTGRTRRGTSCAGTAGRRSPHRSTGARPRRRAWATRDHQRAALPLWAFPAGRLQGSVSRPACSEPKLDGCATGVLGR